MADWIKTYCKNHGKGVIHNWPEEGQLIEAKIRHCNKKLKLKDTFVKGKYGSDGFYLSDGGELSNNWNIIEWRKIT